jgi:chromosomal replication initiator protein
MRLAPPDIVDAAAQAERIPPSSLFTRSRKSRIARARQIAMYLCRKQSGMSFPRIGMFFERDPSVVQRACAVVAARISSDDEFRAKVSQIRERAHHTERVAA